MTFVVGINPYAGKAALSSKSSKTIVETFFEPVRDNDFGKVEQMFQTIAKKAVVKLSHVCIYLGGALYKNRIRRKFIECGKACGFESIKLLSYYEALYLNAMSQSGYQPKEKEIIWIFEGSFCIVWQKMAKTKFIRYIEDIDISNDVLEKFMDIISSFPDQYPRPSIILFNNELVFDKEAITVAGFHFQTFYDDFNYDKIALIKAHVMSKSLEFIHWDAEAILDHLITLNTNERLHIALNPFDSLPLTFSGKLEFNENVLQVHRKEALLYPFPNLFSIVEDESIYIPQCSFIFTVDTNQAFSIKYLHDNSEICAFITSMGVIEEQISLLNNNLSAEESNVNNETPDNLLKRINTLENEKVRINFIRSTLSFKMTNQKNEKEEPLGILVDEEKKLEIVKNNILKQLAITIKLEYLQLDTNLYCAVLTNIIHEANFILSKPTTSPFLYNKLADQIDEKIKGASTIIEDIKVCGNKIIIISLNDLVSQAENTRNELNKQYYLWIQFVAECDKADNQINQACNVLKDFQSYKDLRCIEHAESDLQKLEHANTLVKSFNSTFLKFQNLKKRLDSNEKSIVDFREIKKKWKKISLDFENNIMILNNEISEEQSIKVEIKKIADEVINIINDVPSLSIESLNEMSENKLSTINCKIRRYEKMNVEARQNRRFVTRDEEPSLDNINNSFNKLEQITLQSIRNLNDFLCESHLSKTQKEAELFSKQIDTIQVSLTRYQDYLSRLPKDDINNIEQQIVKFKEKIDAHLVIRNELNYAIDENMEKLKNIQKNGFDESNEFIKKDEEKSLTSQEKTFIGEHRKEHINELHHHIHFVQNDIIISFNEIQHRASENCIFLPQLEFERKKAVNFLQILKSRLDEKEIEFEFIDSTLKKIQDLRDIINKFTTDLQNVVDVNDFNANKTQSTLDFLTEQSAILKQHLDSIDKIPKEVINCLSEVERSHYDLCHENANKLLTNFFQRCGDQKKHLNNIIQWKDACVRLEMHLNKIELTPEEKIEAIEIISRGIIIEKEEHNEKNSKKSDEIFQTTNYLKTMVIIREKVFNRLECFHEDIKTIYQEQIKWRIITSTQITEFNEIISARLNQINGELLPEAKKIDAVLFKVKTNFFHLEFERIKEKFRLLTSLLEKTRRLMIERKIFLNLLQELRETIELTMSGELNSLQDNARDQSNRISDQHRRAEMTVLDFDTSIQRLNDTARAPTNSFVSIEPEKEPSFELDDEAVDIAKLIDQAEDIKKSLEKLSAVDEAIEKPEQYALLVKVSREGRSGLEQILTKIDDARDTKDAIQEYRNRVVALIQSLLILEDQLSQKLKQSAEIHDKYRIVIGKTKDAKEAAEQVLNKINPSTTSLHHVQETIASILNEISELEQAKLSILIAKELQAKCEQLGILSEDKTYDKLLQKMKINLKSEQVKEVLIQTLSNANYISDDINKVLLVGGGCRMPMIQQLLTKMFTKAEHSCHEHPDEIMAIDAAYYASFLKSLKKCSIMQK